MFYKVIAGGVVVVAAHKAWVLHHNGHSNMVMASCNESEAEATKFPTNRPNFNFNQFDRNVDREEMMKIWKSREFPARFGKRDQTTGTPEQKWYLFEDFCQSFEPLTNIKNPTQITTNNNFWRNRYFCGPWSVNDRKKFSELMQNRNFEEFEKIRKESWEKHFDKVPVENFKGFPENIKKDFLLNGEINPGFGRDFADFRTRFTKPSEQSQPSE